MDAHEVLIVGGGPAGSTCAWQLRRFGIDVAILDRAKFPRDKVCAGWITPQVIEELEFDLADYARECILQPITAFRTSRLGDPQVSTRYRHAVSYAIRRMEFDHYLLKRSGATLYEGEPLSAIESSGGGWIVNGHIKAGLVIGAGGYFCPVARQMGVQYHDEDAIVAQETEFRMTPSEAAACAISPEAPELFFCPDMKGYGWCIRKGDYLNIGMGRSDRRALPEYVSRFVAYLKRVGKIGLDLRPDLRGHAYLLYRRRRRPIAGDRLLLIGDAAGLAYAHSGEGIRPAVESGLIAAAVIAGIKGRYEHSSLLAYELLLSRRFDRYSAELFSAVGRHLPDEIAQILSRVLMRSSSFARRVVLGRWFLRSSEVALRASDAC